LNFWLARVERGDVVNCPKGLGFTIWFQGCSIRCKGCHNQELWDFSDGIWTNCDGILADIKENRHWIGMVVFLGGEPTDQKDALMYMNWEIRREGIPTMLYTGRELGELNVAGFRISDFDIVKIGRFREDLQVKGLPLASCNQFIIRNGGNE
jgi:anaerobic ribonucleoside-triphosphate reductase activating protein